MVKVHYYFSLSRINGFVLPKKLNKPLFSFVILFISFVNCEAQFTPGNLVVERIGTGAGALSSAATAVFLDEYTTSGTLVQTIAMPTTVSGTNRILTESGTATSDGGLELSTNGQYLTVTGYDAALGTAAVVSTASATFNRIVALINAAGTVNTCTRISDAYSGNNIRCAATVDGSVFWTSGASSAIRYLPFNNASPYTTTSISTTPATTRQLEIYSNQLYITSASGSNIGINSVTGGLATSGPQTVSILPGLSSGTPGNAYNFIFFDMDPSVSGYDLLYVADNTGGLYKFSFDGTNWTARGSANAILTGITGYINCSGQPVLYVTAGTSANNTIVSYTDNAAYNANISGSFSATIVAAGANKVFRGLKFTPAMDLTVSSAQNISGTYQNITIASGGYATLTGSVKVTGTLTVQSGGTLDCGTNTVQSVGSRKTTFDLQSGGTLKIGSSAGITASAASGNIQTCSRNYSTGANYEYNGTVAQVSGDGLPATTNNLTISNSLGVTLTNSVSVSNLLSLSNGILQTGANQVSVTNSATTAISSFSNSSYVNGTLARNILSNGSYDFPLGTSAQYEWATINFNSQTGISSITGSFTTPPNGASPNPSICIINETSIISLLDYGFWTFTPDLPLSGGTYDITLRERGYTNSAGNPSYYGVVKRVNSTGDWLGCGTIGGVDQNTGVHVNSTQSEAGGTVTAARSQVPSFSDFAIGFSNSTTLPIELLSFSAANEGPNVICNWQTASELNNDFFTIERSADGISFSPLAYIKGSGTSTTYHNYSWSDKNPFSGLSYYRLKQTDFDNNYSYSDVVSISRNSSDSLKIFPNPAFDFISVVIPEETVNDAALTIINSTGTIVYSEKINANKSRDIIQIPVMNLPRGYYLITFASSNQIKRVKLCLE